VAQRQRLAASLDDLGRRIAREALIDVADDQLRAFRRQQNRRGPSEA